MNFLKKNYKYVIVFILGLIVASSVAVYATYSYFADDIGYIRNNTTMSVEDALNDLYTRSSSITIHLRAIDYNNSTIATSWFGFDSDIAEKYNYFKIINLSSSTTIVSSGYRGSNIITKNNDDILENTEYNIDNYSSFWINVKGENARAECDLVLYNK